MVVFMENLILLRAEKYFQQAIEEFNSSDLFEQLKSVARNGQYHLDVHFGPTRNGRQIHYGISISLMDKSNRFVADDGREDYVMAYTTIVLIKGSRIDTYRWDDLEFLSDIERMISFIHNHSKVLL